MAGFFGLFNYEKEGPGIEKDAPPKKTFIVFLGMFKINFWKFIPVSLIYVLLNIPVITGGLADAGITNVMRNTARDKHSFGMSDFFETIKKNWKQSLIAGIINTLITVISLFAARFYQMNYNESANQGGSGNLIWLAGFGVIMSLLLVFNFAKYYLWTMIITFNLKLKDIYKNSFKLAVANLWRNFLVGILLLLTYVIYAAIVYFFTYPVVWVLVGFLAVCTLPAYRYLMIQFVAFPAIKKYMIDPYYEEHPDDDIEQRRKLGLID
ncbi:MAG: DUF624 domain-containing protein [Clostridia bacterium]|nr:DUF624 domain-containing protein [Clostridia bacterium]